MGKKLKLGFAMGGGVSLGAFSGGALSEVIKQAVLNAGYKDGEKWLPYDDIIVDVFSGASAGSLSLAIMLRGMAYPSEEEIRIAKKNLEEDKFINFKFDPSRTKDNQLIVAQVVQNLQREVWAKEVSIEKLLPPDVDLKNEGGIFRRGLLEDIAKKIFRLNYKEEIEFSKKQILADRVLFASTLSNLTGLTYDSRAGASDENYKPLADAYTSETHKEIRVFDLFFTDRTQDFKRLIGNKPVDPLYPPHWVRYHNGVEIKNTIGSLTAKKTWSQIIATSMACGAFPFAFTPVTLKRFKFEYVPKELWPSELDNISETYFGEKDTYPFTYIDGGAFNNEPVREAFRLASHLDAGEDPDKFDRVIAFVDPNVANHPILYKIPVYQDFSYNEKGTIKRLLGYKPMLKRSTLDRFLPHAITLIKMIRDQASIDENDKIFNTLKLFEDRKKYNEVFDIVVDAVNPKDVDQVIGSLKKNLTELIENQKQNEFLPRAITLDNELKRIIYENKIKFAGLLDNSGELPENLNDNQKRLLLKACFSVFIDQMIYLTGKSPDAKIVGIAPARWIDNKGYVLNKPELESLPGEELAAFAGFFCEESRDFAVDAGIYCAFQFMKDMGLFKSDIPSKNFDWNYKSKIEENLYKSIKEKLYIMEARIQNMLNNSSLIQIPLIDRFLYSQINNKIKKGLEKMNFMESSSVTHILKIMVPEADFEVDGRKLLNDIKAIKTDKEYFIITEIKCFLDKDGKFVKWDNDGTYVENDSINLNKSVFLSLADRNFCKITLPEKSLVDIGRLMPNLIFQAAITESDKGKLVSASIWKIKSDHVLLEEALLM